MPITDFRQHLFWNRPIDAVLKRVALYPVLCEVPSELKIKASYLTSHWKLPDPVLFIKRARRNTSSFSTRSILLSLTIEIGIR